MKYLHFVIIFLMIISCNEEKQLRVEYISIDSEQLKLVYYTKDGIKNGISLTYFENGDTAEISNYVNGKLHGINKVFYHNGKILSKNKFKHGQLINTNFWDVYGNNTLINGSGYTIFHYDNGKPKSKTKYLKNKLHGKSIYWYENGNIKMYTEFYMPYNRLQ
jgi:antitoxin component YwqK of YwqJK toxin-antitoxin module